METWRWILCVYFMIITSVSSNPIEVSWDFDEGLEGWGNATREEMQLDLSYRGSELRAQVRGEQPHLDSPPLTLNIIDRHYIVTRMMYSSAEVTKGKWVLRGGAGPSPEEIHDHKRMSWERRSGLFPISTSPETADMAAAVDGDPYTLWSAPVGIAPWITFDLGGYYHLTEVMIQVPESDTPRTVRLEKALTYNGEYRNVYTFTVLQNVSSPQSFTGFSAWGQYWRVHVIDGYGSLNVSIREVELRGPDPIFREVEFDLIPDGHSHTYYIPIHQVFSGKLTRIRFHPSIENKDGYSPNYGHAFTIDWIRIIKAPTVRMVTGCIDQYFTDGNLYDPLASITLGTTPINDFLIKRETIYSTPPDRPYATTYNCLQAGGQAVVIRGTNFGASVPIISIGNSLCEDIICTSSDTYCSCITPTNAGGAQTVTLTNAEYPGLVEEVEYLQYQTPPDQILMPSLSNIGAHSIDVSWEPPEDMWSALTTTGYLVSWYELEEGEIWMEDGSDDGWQSVSVGNVTTTTIIDLPSDTLMMFRVAAVAENQTDVEWTQLDLYGRRSLLGNAEVGPASQATNTTATLPWDFHFDAFTANATLNHSATDGRSSLGPSGVFGGEGHHGLALVGDANLQNCNSSTACCDGYNATRGLQSCADQGGYMCSAVFRGKSTDEGEIPSTSTGGKGFFPASKSIARYDEASAFLPEVSFRCGPALRLTPSSAGQVGAAWYPRMMNVREGFETSFTFEISNPSVRCTHMNDVYTHCRARGADGFAFVIQQQSQEAMGESGKGLGYQGIQNSIAVEFDTFFNPDLLEPYENHISIHTRGWRYTNSVNHSYSLGASVDTADLTDGTHQVKIIYRPNFNVSTLFGNNFELSGHVGHFLENADFPAGAMADWGANGLGTLSVFVDDLETPLFVAPLALDSTLDLHHGRAWVGFTAATGEDTWQVHDILDWKFTMLREDLRYSPPVLINDVGAHSCSSFENGICVHF
eukprot:CAMPEP_0117769996 /NCGR_PEP_ID=MMETSP0947-20121206/23453_1 /TAXON_ID=44440 /ORGANISM="Chattonella subsalsa, Strain CCMP2191" /LENGTH=979 /DNA_ID=CAMNT_0005594775 /DNA_START=113 /DNA_END=3052 /DNA_ORIENTATION=-